MTNETQTKYTIGKTKFRTSVMLTIWNEETQEEVFSIMSHEVVGGIKEARRIIKRKFNQLVKKDMKKEVEEINEEMEVKADLERKYGLGEETGEI